MQAIEEGLDCASSDLLDPGLDAHGVGGQQLGHLRPEAGEPAAVDEEIGVPEDVRHHQALLRGVVARVQGGNGRLPEGDELEET